MSVKAKIIIDKKEINVLWYNFKFNQEADYNGRPSQKPVFSGLQLKIETRKDLNLADWSFAPDETKQLELHIYPIILGGKTRKLYFYDSHLVYWNNSFTSIGNEPMSETLHITAAGVEDSNSEGVYSANWRKTYPQQQTQPTIIKNEKKVTNFIITNVNNEEIQDYKKNDIIILNIETQNRIGDVVNVNLDDAEYDFEYNGNLVIDNTISNIVISNDLEQLELKVVEQKSKHHG
ncbi:hypothetical protein KO493_01805 [Tamlana agarivorans]|uniref:Uncharacterized protein n=1 Tax=Pseudotamlana agarivorans TaxID=481183 RepID=A0ACC5U542_9FLAO|nr:type VI secretion system tube protein TssD [Tamlana agarivorans]MBU2949425.1 hypothetical protein [Tamlana agarivorans]